ncbi:hypothetical protein E4U17_001367 [Claviceps sp. LM77 group G4]|nr:hypothetical protein E4U17_001367 [Claviceps sp. LM77 group G4]KAG6045833.1 hypothetical protein E4U33_001279 [Claviceps sp. LM78 group G4]
MQRSKVRDDPTLLHHFNLAYEQLQRGLGTGDFRYDLLIMLVMTLSAPSQTPYINIKNQKNGYYFDLMDGTRDRQGAAMYAATVVTRMLWHLTKEQFDPAPPNTASVEEVTKRLEHYKVTYWLMVGIGWVDLSNPNCLRRSLRRHECVMRSDAALREYYVELDRLRVDDPDGFIYRIFHGRFPIRKYNWVEVCKSSYSEY